MVGAGGRAADIAAVSMLVWLAAAAAPPGAARASQGDMFGVGPAAMGRGNGGVALENEAASAFYNPAALALTPFDVLSVGGQLGFGTFAEAEGVEWTDGRDDPIPQPALPPHGLYLGLTKRIAPPVRFGMTLTLPEKGFFYFEQEDPYVPSMVRWRNRAQRFQLLMGLSVRPHRAISIGVGVGLGVRARLKIEYAWEGTAGEDEADAAVALANLREAEFQIRPTARPIVGLLLDGGGLSWRLDGLRFGLTYREAFSVSLEQTELMMELLDPGALNGLFSLADKVRATAVMALYDFYTPRQIALGLAWDRPRFAAYLDVTWNDFSAMIPNTGMLQEGREDDGGMHIFWNINDDQVDSYAVVDGRAVDPDTFHDTWTVRGGVEIRPGRHLDAVVGRRTGVTVRLGAGYDPSFVGEQPGPTNFLDGPVISGAAGIGLSGPDPLGLLAGVGGLDLALQVHRALPARYAKDPSLVPARVQMPVTWGDEVSWDGGWMVLVALAGTLRF